MQRTFDSVRISPAEPVLRIDSTIIIINQLTIYYYPRYNTARSVPAGMLSGQHYVYPQIPRTAAD